MLAGQHPAQCPLVTVGARPLVDPRGDEQVRLGQDDLGHRGRIDHPGQVPQPVSLIEHPGTGLDHQPATTDDHLPYPSAQRTGRLDRTQSLGHMTRPPLP